MSNETIPNVITKEERIACLKMGMSGKEIEDMAVLLSGYTKTSM